ncbi:MAG TPA: indolepyruvate ferredoxin oxidoreductase subunit alpha [Ktedonobacteraceae bacterium]
MVNFLTTPGKRLFLTGDEAVARAALEVGVDVATGYPGNPSTKTITALLPLAQTQQMTVEWSVNEKVALEVAAGAAWAGKRALVTMKMSGINVMADSLLSIAHSGVRGALVIYAVDDVGTYYGMVEQDSRHYARLASLPLLMPASPEDAYVLALRAFQLSEETGAPVFLLATTSVANAITTLKVNKLGQRPASRPASFPRDLRKFTKATPQWCLEQHADALLRLEQAGELCAQSPVVNRVLPSRTVRPRLGVVVAGVSFTYLEELRARDPESYGELAVLKLGQVYPLPRQLLRDFLKGLKRVLVLEELEPLIETELLAELAEMGQRTEVLGKRRNGLPRVGDYTIELVQRALDELLARSVAKTAQGSEQVVQAGRVEQGGREIKGLNQSVQPEQKLLPLARTLEFCPGCPHRMSYYALNQAIERLGFAQDEVITTGDIGCTIIGMNAPLDTCWTEVSMGASIGIAQGLKQAGIERPIVAAMGDGTFYHNGIAGLLNAVQAGVNLTLLILDNSRSAMTGMQPDAGTGKRADGEVSVRANIAMLARGCGVEYVRRLDPYQLEETIETLRDAMQYSGVSVVIAEAPCTTQGLLIQPELVQIDQQVCLAGRGCEDTPCYHKVGCPSVLLSLDDLRPRLSIDAATCVSCGLCAAACPFDAIKPLKTEQPAVVGRVSTRDMLQD